MPNNELVFYAFLNQNDDDAWQQVVNALIPSIHPVDQVATRISFGFFPLKLHRTLANSDNPELTARKLLLEGKYRLADQADTSPNFSTAIDTGAITSTRYSNMQRRLPRRTA